MQEQINYVALIWNIVSVLAVLFAILQGIDWIFPGKFEPLKRWIFKPIMKFVRRNTKIEFVLIKSFDVNENTDIDFIEERLRSIFEGIIIEKQDKYFLKGHLKRRNFDINLSLSILEDDYEEEISIILKQTSNIKLSKINDYLSTALWNLNDINDNFDDLTYSTSNMDIAFSSNKFGLFRKLSGILGEDIRGDKLSLRIKDNNIDVNLNDKYEIDIIDKIVDVILLGLNQSR